MWQPSLVLPLVVIPVKWCSGAALSLVDADLLKVSHANLLRSQSRSGWIFYKARAAIFLFAVFCL